MSFLQAIIYFLAEAASGLLRGWKASLLAILTIAVSLFVWGSFLLAGQNLGRALSRWRSEARLIVYLTPEASAATKASIEAEIREAPWVAGVRQVSESEASRRFQQAFPSLEELMEGWSESPLPASLEVTMTSHREDDVITWIEGLEVRPEVDMVDDDRDWISQLESIANLAGTVGLTVGLVLLGAATFTIASVVRLNAYMYQDEISIMRMVGATEFLIRGPFYFEGLLEGLLGALAASGGLYLAYAGLVSGINTESALVDLLLGQFLSWPRLGLLMVIGAVAGLLGAVLSLKGEALAVEEG